MAEPLLTILIPMYNAAATLERTLASLRHIAFRRARVQVVVVNDGSRDQSLALARALAAREPEFQWDLLDQPNRGVSSARNAGLERARGEWLFLLDADDELAFDPLPLLDQAGDTTCFACAVEYCGPGQRVRRVAPPVITPARRADLFTARSPCPISSLLFRRDRARARFDEDIRYNEDWLFWNRNHQIFERVKRLPQTVASIIHIHQTNASANYAAWGRDRVLVAGRILEHFAGQLTRQQRNNLLLQQQIGELQQRRWISPWTFLRFPCDPVLYLKLWVYAFAAIVGFRATPYRPAEVR